MDPIPSPKFEYAFHCQPGEITILDEYDNCLVPPEILRDYKEIAIAALSGEPLPGTMIKRVQGRGMTVITPDGAQLSLSGGFYKPVDVLADGLARVEKGGLIYPPNNENFAETHPDVVTTLMVREDGQIFENRAEFIPTGGYTLAQAITKFENTTFALEQTRVSLDIPEPLFIYHAGNGIFGIASEEARPGSSYERIANNLIEYLKLGIIGGPELLIDELTKTFAALALVLKDDVHNPGRMNSYHGQPGLGNWGLVDDTRPSLTDWATSSELPAEDVARISAISIDLAVLLHTSEKFTQVLLNSLLRKMPEAPKQQTISSTIKLLRGRVLGAYRSGNQDGIPAQNVDWEGYTQFPNVRKFVAAYYDFR